MLEAMVGALKAIIDLLLKRDENKKVRVETKLRERELSDKTSYIQKATLDDVKKYDPKFKAIERNISSITNLIIQIIVIFLLLLCIGALIYIEKN